MAVTMGVISIEARGGIVPDRVVFVRNVFVRNVGRCGVVKAVVMAEVMRCSVRPVLVIDGCRGPDGLERQEHRQKNGQQVAHQPSLAESEAGSPTGARGHCAGTTTGAREHCAGTTVETVVYR